MYRELTGTDIFISHNLSSRINTKRDDIFRENDDDIFLSLRVPGMKRRSRGVQ